MGLQALQMPLQQVGLMDLYIENAGCKSQQRHIETASGLV